MTATQTESAAETHAPTLACLLWAASGLAERLAEADPARHRRWHHVADAAGDARDRCEGFGGLALGLPEALDLDPAIDTPRVLRAVADALERREAR